MLVHAHAAHPRSLRPVLVHSARMSQESVSCEREQFLFFQLIVVDHLVFTVCFLARLLWERKAQQGG